MDIIVVGTGTSGWLVVNQLKEEDYIDKITVIGSPKIPHIGVGESTTLSLPKAHKDFDLVIKDFVKESHAAVKYGVYYKNWSKRDFLHFFKSNDPYVKADTSARRYLNTLGNKDPNTHIHDLMGVHLWEDVNRNLVYYDDADEEYYPRTWHFDAGKYIEYLSKLALKSKKVELISDTVVDVVFTPNTKYIESLVLESGTKIKSDYYINTTGQSFGRNVFKEEYIDLSDTLLTNKAVVYPLEYTNKREQFHPYTVAKTMKNGWRWITPTWERIGTGYTFSTNHITEEQAIDEFLEDIGDKTLKPNVVDFQPRISTQTFKLNHCSIGMANGFLEPLDAPGLSMANDVTISLKRLLEHFYTTFSNNSIETLHRNKKYTDSVLNANDHVHKKYSFWIIFILNQYKTCYRNDTPFWIDHKNVKNEYWELAMSDLNGFCDIQKNDFDVIMLAQTTAGKDIQWRTPTTQKPFVLPEYKPTKVQHHLDYINNFHIFN